MITKTDPQSDILNLNETRALMNAIDSHRDRAIIALILHTGLFLNEVTELTINSIDWSNHQLTITGRRSRTIPLDEELRQLLASWSKERVNSVHTAFFTTTKGKLTPLSDRSIDVMIRTYGKKAKIQKPISARSLRNTFAIHLFQSGIHPKEAATLLGIHDPISIRRYKELADAQRSGASEFNQTGQIDSAAQQVENEHTDFLDTRSPLTKLTQKLFPIEPKPAILLRQPTFAKATAGMSFGGHVTPYPEEVIFGRDSVLRDINHYLANEQSTLIIGEPGIGKTHILKHIDHQKQSSLYLSANLTVKSMLASIQQELDSPTSDVTSPKSGRINVEDLIKQIQVTPKTQLKLLILDDLHRYKQPQKDMLAQLFDHFTILCASLPPKNKQDSFWWKFKLIELKPLEKEAEKELIAYLTQNLPISDYELMETHLITLANGYPLPIVDMIKQLQHEPVVNRKSIRKLYHEGGVRYRDWSYFVMVIWGGLVMCRFFALGTHSFEGYILSGMGLSVLLVLRFFLFKMR